jgi:hypothetical protein
MFNRAVLTKKHFQHLANTISWIVDLEKFELILDFLFLALPDFNSSFDSNRFNEWSRTERRVKLKRINKQTSAEERNYLIKTGREKELKEFEKAIKTLEQQGESKKRKTVFDIQKEKTLGERK